MPGDAERSQHRTLLQSRVAGHYGYLVEQPGDTGHGLRKYHGDFVLNPRRGPDGATASLEGVPRRRMQRRVQQDLHGINHVVGGKRRAIGEQETWPQLEDNALAAVRSE